MTRTQLQTELLETRETPAVLYSYAASHLRIWFDNAPVVSATPFNEQAVTVSAYQGVVTLNEMPLRNARNHSVLAHKVSKITVDGSAQANWIDLHFVDHRIGTGFTPALSGHVTIRGHDGNDYLVGSGYADRIRGGSGNDVVQGRDGNDWLAGDAGEDELYGGGGRDVLQGGSGRDYFDWLMAGDRHVDLQPGEVAYYFGTTAEAAAADAALIAMLRKAHWNLGDEQ